MAVKISTSFGDVNSLKSQIPVNLLVENVIIVAYENRSLSAGTGRKWLGVKSFS